MPGDPEELKKAFENLEIMKRLRKMKEKINEHDKLWAYQYGKIAEQLEEINKKLDEIRKILEKEI